MKNLLLIIFSLASIGVYAQKAGKGSGNDSWIPPMNSYSYRYDIRANENLRIDLAIYNKRSKKNLAWKNMAGMLTFGAGSNYHHKEQKERNKLAPINISLLAGMAGMNIFTKKMQPLSIVEAKQYDLNGILLHSERLKVKSGKKSMIYTYSPRFKQDGFLILTVDNVSKKTVQASSIGEYLPVPESLKDFAGLKISDPSPTTNSQVPIWTFDLGEVTITGSSPNSTNTDTFAGRYEAALGPSMAWTAVSSGSNGTGSSSGGGESEGPPTAEAKAKARKLTELGANECESQYLLDHWYSDPLMLPKLITTRSSVENYMNTNNMGAANENGAAMENAFKHALFSAYNFCEIGPQHAEALANFHEVCNGVNRNPNNAEWFMDDYNNHEGFKIAASVGCGNLNNIISAVTNAYKNGTLHDINGNPTAP